MGLAKLFIYAGLLCIVHSGFSSAHWKWIVGNHTNPGTPTDIYVELIVGYVMAMLGALFHAVDFKLIRTTTDSLSKGPSTDFYVFSHRGMSLARRRKREERLDID